MAEEARRRPGKRRRPGSADDMPQSMPAVVEPRTGGLPPGGGAVAARRSGRGRHRGGGGRDRRQRRQVPCRQRHVLGRPAAVGEGARDPGPRVLPAPSSEVEEGAAEATGWRRATWPSPSRSTRAWHAATAAGGSTRCVRCTTSGFQRGVADGAWATHMRFGPNSRVHRCRQACRSRRACWSSRWPAPCTVSSGPTSGSTTSWCWPGHARRGP